MSSDLCCLRNPKRMNELMLTRASVGHHFLFKGTFRIDFASNFAGSVSTLCSPPYYTQTDKPVEVRDRSAMWVTRE